VSFTVAPQVRDIRFHHLEDLSAEDFFFKYHFSPYGHLPVEGDPLFVDILKMISLGHFYLGPGESREFQVAAVPGALFGFDMIQGAGFMVQIQEGPGAGAQKLTVTITDQGQQASLARLSPGPLSIKFVNQTGSKASMMFNIMPADKKKAALVFDPFLTGKSLFNNQTFRQLYPSATLGEKGGIGVKDLTLLFTDLKGSTAMYDRIGDLKAFSLVQQHFERLTKAIQANGGAVVKTIGDAVMASFDKPTSAVKAAAEMLKEIEEFNKEHGSTEIILKIGIHRGASIAVTLNDRLDYFGQTVNIAARVQGLAGAEEIYLTKNVFLSPGVKELLEDFYVTPETASLKGIQKAMQVYKVTYEAPAASPKTKSRKKRSKAKSKHSKPKKARRHTKRRK
jgi:class 3 adenylate cyclase